MYSFLGLGRNLPRCSACGLEIQTPSSGVPQQFSGGGGNSCSCILGVQSHPPHSPPISPLGSMWRFRRKARSSACSDLTHHLHHPVLPDANNRGALPLRARKINHHAVPFLPANALEGKNARIGTLLVAGISLQESVTKAINALPCI